LIELKPLHNTIGVEVIGLDLRNPIDSATQSILKDAWLKHLVLLFRDQELTEKQQVDFARNFGTPKKADTPRADDLPDQDLAIVLIGNIHNGNLPNGEVSWHSDSTWYERPNKATMLYAVEVPSSGGNTLFQNMYLAYDEVGDYRREDGAHIGPVFLEYLDGRMGVNSYQRKIDPEPITAKHPVFMEHEETGRKVIYVNRLHTKDITGPNICGPCYVHWLCEYIEQREHYQHVWRPNDLIVWDNRCTQHARTDFNPSEKRLLRRVGIQ
jgi:taurine dioxygenase